MDKAEILRTLRAKGFTTTTVRLRRGHDTGTFAYRVRGTVRDMIGFGTRFIYHTQEITQHQYLGPNGSIYPVPEAETKRRRIPVRAGYFTVTDLLASL